MMYLLDTANLEAIKKGYDLYPIVGVTTNPSIISKEQGDFLQILGEIREIIGPDSMLHVQVLGLTAVEMVKEAYFLKENIAGSLYIKIPVLPEGIKAMKILKKEGFGITATAIFTSDQALMAAMAGADFVAPYVNRIDNISGNGVAVVKEIVKKFQQYGLDTKVLAASFKNVQQIHEVSLCGAQSLTAPLEIIEQTLAHPLTDWSVDQFIKDWNNVYGDKLVYQLNK